MTLGYAGDLYILAFDHRASFEKDIFGLDDEPTPAEHEQICEAKEIILEGVLRAVQEGAPKTACGVLVDEEFGAAVARRAQREGLILAMPAEHSGLAEFQFQYGDDFGAHIEAFDPTFTKVLVRYNPEGDSGLNARQTARLARLSDWLRSRDRKLLFELLVPPTEPQLAAAGGDRERYEQEVRPELMARTVSALQDGGVEPDVWKIEGLDRRADCLGLLALARAGGRDQVACIVLGGGADPGRVERWLRVGAEAGFQGFAIGRTIWLDAEQGLRTGSIDRAAAVGTIAANYRRAIEVYQPASPEHAR